MSMPKFPEIDPEISCERALHMILASIAMEELALSHIINAEGEKLQYVLGTLETSRAQETDIAEILKVNQSVSGLLDSVSQNQMILKNKMDKALHALSEICPCSPDPVCRPGPRGPTGPQGPPGERGPAGPSGSCCSCKCSAVFRAAEKGRLWCAGSGLHWKPEQLHGTCIGIDPYDQTKIEICGEGRFLLHFSANVKARVCRCNAAISLQKMQNRQCTEIYSVYSPTPCDDAVFTISMNGMLIENLDCASSLFYKLKSPDSWIVEDAIVTIVEL